MTSRNEFQFAEVLVDKLFLESFANEHSPYYAGGESSGSASHDRVRSKLKWHIGHSLSKRQKQVLRYYLSGKREREIAHILGITQQVVNIYKQRAIKKLHKLLVS